MTTNDKKLKIFENFIVNRKPKRNPNENEGSIPEDALMMNPSSGNFMTIGGTAVSSNEGFYREENVKIVDYLNYTYTHNKTFINWFKLGFVSFFLKQKIKKTPVIIFQEVKHFFDEIHLAVRELNLTDKSVKFYTDAITDALANGQQALAEILYSKKDVLMKELSLAKEVKGLKYIDEDDVVEYFGKAETVNKMLHLTWIKNYTRVIPPEVVEAKKVFDELELFDNYVILHFDRNGDASEMTIKEKEKAKDPILFGVIKDSRKLYFVGDWIDEYCDLTLNKFLKVLEKKSANKLTNHSIKKEVTNHVKVNIEKDNEEKD